MGAEAPRSKPFVGPNCLSWIQTQRRLWVVVSTNVTIWLQRTLHDNALKSQQSLIISHCHTSEIAESALMRSPSRHLLVLHIPESIGAIVPRALELKSLSGGTAFFLLLTRSVAWLLNFGLRDPPRCSYATSFASNSTHQGGSTRYADQMCATKRFSLVAVSVFACTAGTTALAAKPVVSREGAMTVLTIPSTEAESAARFDYANAKPAELPAATNPLCRAGSERPHPRLELTVTPRQSRCS